MRESKPGSKSETASAIRDTVGGIAAKGKAAMATDKESFVKNAVISDMYEIEAAKIAVARARREDVRDFARHMIRDHGKLTEELKSVARGRAVSPPDSLDMVHRGMIDDLNGAADEDFDRRYLAQQESAHTTALLLFQNYQDKGDDSTLRDLAKMTAPVLKHHLEMVQHMSRSA